MTRCQHCGSLLSEVTLEPGTRRVRVTPGIYMRSACDGSKRYEITYTDSDGRQRWETVGDDLHAAIELRKDRKSTNDAKRALRFMRERSVRERPQQGFVYFMVAEGGEMAENIKIGKTIDIVKRKRDLERTYGDLTVELLIHVNDYSAAECVMHKRFASLRIGRSEWFRPDLALVDFIAKAKAVHHA